MPITRERKEIQALREKIEALQSSLSTFEELEERVSGTIEEKIFEIKAISYVILIISAVMLAINLGVLIKTFLK